MKLTICDSVVEVRPGVRLVTKSTFVAICDFIEFHDRLDTHLERLDGCGDGSHLINYQSNHCIKCGELVFRDTSDIECPECHLIHNPKKTRCHTLWERNK